MSLLCFRRKTSSSVSLQRLARFSERLSAFVWKGVKLVRVSAKSRDHIRAQSSTCLYMCALCFIARRPHLAVHIPSPPPLPSPPNVKPPNPPPPPPPRLSFTGLFATLPWALTPLTT